MVAHVVVFAIMTRRYFSAWAMMLALSLGGAAQTASKAAPAGPVTNLKAGDIAPDFTLHDQNGKAVKLSDFRGKQSVALAFYVFAFTGG